MKLVTYVVDGCPRPGVIHDGTVADLLALAQNPEQAAAFRSVRSVLSSDGGLEAARELVEAAASGDQCFSWPNVQHVELMAPIGDPGKVLALAGNYLEHIREGSSTASRESQLVPNVFIKPASCVVGPGASVELPGAICTTVDYEGELGVVIGRTCKNVLSGDALNNVAGYLNVNDVSGRRLNVDRSDATPRTHFFDWLNGKWFDTFAPTGPYLVLKDEIPDPQDLDLELRVNGEVRQRANTSEMILSVAETVAWISRFVTLDPGDIIATGTPAGVGAASGTYLQAGDVMELEISGLGVLNNTVA